MPEESAVQNVMEEVAEIIRRVGKRDDIEDEVAENISYADLVAELTKQEGPVREAVKKIVINFIKSYEIDSESDEAGEIIGAIDFKEIIGDILKNEEAMKALTSSVTAILENASDNESFGEAVDGAFGLSDSEELVKVLGEKGIEKMNLILAKKIEEYLQEMDVTNLEPEVQANIEAAMFTEEHVRSCCEKQDDRFTDAIAEVVGKVIDSTDANNTDDALVKIILDNPILKVAIDSSVKELVESGRIDKLVQDTAESMLSDENSELRSELKEAISEKLVARIADSVVDGLFNQRR